MRREDKEAFYETVIISIHAPIVGCDCRFWKNCYKNGISIHAPIVGCDCTTILSSVSFIGFQSTHPSWGATSLSLALNLMLYYFNPRTHRGVRLLDIKESNYHKKNFNPRTHRGVRHSRASCCIYLLVISIHAPIVGCDQFK